MIPTPIIERKHKYVELSKHTINTIQKFLMSKNGYYTDEDYEFLHKTIMEFFPRELLEDYIEAIELTFDSEWEIQLHKNTVEVPELGVRLKLAMIQEKQIGLFFDVAIYEPNIRGLPVWVRVYLSINGENFALFSKQQFYEVLM